MTPQLDTARIGALLGGAACVVALLSSNGKAWPVIVVAALPLVARAAWRTMPVWVLLAGTAVPVAIAEGVENRPTSATWLIGCVALVVAAVDRRHPLEWIPITLVVSGPLWLDLAGVTDRETAITAIWIMGLLLSATGGTIVGQQRQLVASMHDAQASLAAAAAADERQRIARDLHDMVGHSFSVVLLHLAGARHLMATDPTRAEAALRQAEDVGRESMNDLRASLALLRSNDVSHAPVGDLAALPGLVEGMRRAGLDVTFRATGSLDRVAPAIAVVIHSVAREALTNAAKHAATGPVVCELDVEDHAVLRVVNVVDPSPDGPTRDPDGHGVHDMRERARAVGGTLEVVRSGGEWSVVLDIPVHAGGRVR